MRTLRVHRSGIEPSRAHMTVASGQPVSSIIRQLLSACAVCLCIALDAGTCDHAQAVQAAVRGTSARDYALFVMEWLF
jgi:hypothetical protein